MVNPAQVPASFFSEAGVITLHFRGAARFAGES
jgi:hypothetical protein